MYIGTLDSRWFHLLTIIGISILVLHTFLGVLPIFCAFLLFINDLLPTYEGSMCEYTCDIDTDHESDSEGKKY